MNRYVKAILGGFLALLAAFGWTVTLAFLVLMKSGGGIVGVEINKRPEILIPVVLIFAAGFYLAFRAAYSKTH